MNRYNEVYYNQFLGVYNGWIGKRLLARAFTSQYRVAKCFTSVYRKIKAFTSGG